MPASVLDRDGADLRLDARPHVAIGNLGGFVGPYLVGWLNHGTGSTSAGFVMLAVSLLIGSLITLMLPKPSEPPATEPTAARV